MLFLNTRNKQKPQHRKVGMLNPSISASMGLSSVNRAKVGMAVLMFTPGATTQTYPKPGEFPGQVLRAIIQTTKQRAWGLATKLLELGVKTEQMCEGDRHSKQENKEVSRQHSSKSKSLKTLANESEPFTSYQEQSERDNWVKMLYYIRKLT